MLTQVPLPERHALTPHGVELAYPRLPGLMRAFNLLTRPLAPRLWPIEPEVLRRRARSASKVADFSTGTAFDEPLDILCRSLREEMQLSPNGQFALHNQLITSLANQFRLDELAARRPDIFEAPVSMPLFVTGMVRSGTTFTQKLIACDPRWRTLPLWEVTHPLPKGDLTARRPEPDPRIKISRVETKITNRMLPEQASMHELAHDAPEEENLLLSMSHCSPMFEAMALVPQYAKWYATADHTDGYRYFKRILQFMRWSRPAGDRWALKAPGHLEMLVPLYDVFEDATVVQTHRDPVTSVISYSNLITYGARVYFDHPDPYRFGTFAADFVERLLRASIRDREQAGRPVVDVLFHRLIEDPLREMRRVYEAADLELDGVAEKAMREYATAEKSRSRHQYAAEDFSLSVPELRERFAFYYDHFDVPMEQR